MEINLCPIENIPENGMRQFEIQGLCVLLCRTGDRIHAVNGICPHRGAQLGSGALEGSTLTCPWHDWSFDVASGCGITNPMSGLITYEVVIKAGQILVSLPDP